MDWNSKPNSLHYWRKYNNQDEREDNNIAETTEAMVPNTSIVRKKKISTDMIRQYRILGPALCLQ